MRMPDLLDLEFANFALLTRSGEGIECDQETWLAWRIDGKTVAHCDRDQALAGDVWLDQGLRPLPRQRPGSAIPPEAWCRLAARLREQSP
jgi:hypothetical protein